MPVVKIAPGAFGAGYQGFDTNGKPLNAGLIYTYSAGTTTSLATYTTSAGTVQNSNPIVLGVDGRAGEIWLLASNSYRFDVKDSAGNLIKTYDNLIGINSLPFVSVTTFGATGDGSTDDTAACQAALNTGGAVYFPAGTYKITTGLAVSIDQKIFGDGMAKTIIAPTGAGVHGFVQPVSGIFVRNTISDMSITGGSTTGSGLYFSTSQVFQSVFRNLAISMGGNAVHAPSEFSSLFDTVYVSSATGHGFFVQSGNTTTFLNCYAVVITTAGKAGYRCYNGGTFISCNGLNSGTNWGIFGSTVALDGADNVYTCVFDRCNMEAFNSGTGCIFRYQGYAAFRGGGFTISSGNYTTCIDLETGIGLLDIDGTLFNTSGGSKAKLADVFTNGVDYPIMVRGTSNLSQIDENGTLRDAPTLTTGLVVWTPTLRGSATAGTNTYTLQFGRYRIDGQMVTAWFRIVLSGNSVAMVGNLQVAGLPFTQYSSLSFPGSGSVGRYDNITFDAGFTQLNFALTGGTVIQIYETGSNKTATPLPIANINAATGIIEGVVQYLR